MELCRFPRKSARKSDYLEVIWCTSKTFQTSSYGPVWPLNFSLEKTSSYIRITTKYILCQEFLVYSRHFGKQQFTSSKWGMYSELWRDQGSSLFCNHSPVSSANFFIVKNILILFILTKRQREGSDFSSTVWVQDYLSSPATQTS